MRIEEITSKLSGKKKGCFIRVTYNTILDLTADAKRAGYILDKHTVTTVRWGINYSNIARVKEERQRRVEEDIPTRKVTQWWSWTPNHENVIRQHNTSGQYYLVLFPIRSNHYTESYYFLNGKPITEDKVKEMNIVPPSHWNKASIAEYAVKVENVISIR